MRWDFHHGRLVCFAVGCAVLSTGWPAASYGQQTSTSSAAGAAQEASPPRTPIPPVTDADRAAAFPDVDGHTVPDNAVHSFVLFDHLEWQGGQRSNVASWDASGWVGHDLNRLWFRAEGEADSGRLGDAEAHLLYGRAVARWWEVVVGLRQDLRPGPAQSWLAVGVQGMAPYWFDVEATAYLSAGGQTAVRLEAGYELLFTRRLVLQPLVELNLYGQTNAERGIGASLSSFDAGLRVRYELRREFAPYLGVIWNNRVGETAALADAACENGGALALVVRDNRSTKHRFDTLL